VCFFFFGFLGSRRERQQLRCILPLFLFLSFPGLDPILELCGFFPDYFFFELTTVFPSDFFPYRAYVVMAPCPKFPPPLSVYALVLSFTMREIPPLCYLPTSHLIDNAIPHFSSVFILRAFTSSCFHLFYSPPVPVALDFLAPRRPASGFFQSGSVSRSSFISN